jgi:hypothetical protein
VTFFGKNKLGSPNQVAKGNLLCKFFKEHMVGTIALKKTRPSCSKNHVLGPKFVLNTLVPTILLAHNFLM